MFKMNRQMEFKLAAMERECKLFPPDLLELILQGFYMKDGCFFLTELEKRKTNATLSNFQDKTGYECFINSLHIDDYVQDHYLEYSCLFVNEIFNSWKKSGLEKAIVAIVSIDELGAVVKIHLARNNEKWLGDDLDLYEEAIFTIDSFSSVKLA